MFFEDSRTEQQRRMGKFQEDLADLLDQHFRSGLLAHEAWEVLMDESRIECVEERREESLQLMREEEQAAQDREERERQGNKPRASTV